MRQHPEALLGTGVQPDRLPRLHVTEGDEVAVPLARTESLSRDRRAKTGLTGAASSAISTALGESIAEVHMLRRGMLATAVLVALMAAPGTAVASAGSASGNKTCTANNSVRIWSRTSKEVWHLWSGAADYWPNTSTSVLKASYTSLHSTWWTVSWSVASDGQGTSCYFDP
jgi:hypothetical protein